MGNPQEPTVQYRELCQCYSAAWVGVWGQMDTCIRTAEPLRCTPEAITTLLTGYTSKQNEKLKKILTTNNEEHPHAKQLEKTPISQKKSQRHNTEAV